MGKNIQTYLIGQYPELAELLEEIECVQPLVCSDIPVGELVVKVVIGQMLSRKAASSIYAKVKSAAEKSACREIWELNRATFRKCGLSERKYRTIKEFSALYKSDPDFFNNWYDLDSDSLFQAVNSQWGMSDWTASMLGIFHMGHEDIFPYRDGSIVRALELLRTNWGVEIDVTKAKPYSSYLALYLWRALDSGLLDK